MVPAHLLGTWACSRDTVPKALLRGLRSFRAVWEGKAWESRKMLIATKKSLLQQMDRVNQDWMLALVER